METYIVSIVLEDVDFTDDVLDVLFAKVEDAVPSSVDGVVKLTAPVEAADDESAAFHLIDQVHALLPGAIAARLDQDLVAIPDIAERTERSRESIRLLVNGKRGPGGFPGPVGAVGDAIRVWPWAVVLDWFRESMKEDLGERGVSPQAAALVDACLAGRRRQGFVHRTQVAWSPAPRPVRAKVVVTSDEVTTGRSGGRGVALST